MASEKRLIDVNAASEEISSLRMFITGIRFGQGVLSEYIKEYRKSILRILNDAPTVDAVEVVHGKWRLETDEEEPNGFLKLLVCTACNKTAGGGNYCPNCGAKMDGGE